MWQLPAALMRHQITPRVVTDMTSRNYTVPISASWVYVPLGTMLYMDERLASSWEKQLHSNETCIAYGWMSSFGWAEGATDAWDSFTRR